MKLDFFFNRFSKNIQMSNFMKIRPWGAELFHADGWTDGRAGGRTDMTNILVTLRCFANCPTNVLYAGGIRKIKDHFSGKLKSSLMT
jgi:hypothetical protein